MADKHTPGPWWVEGDRIVAAVDGKHAATIGDAWNIGEMSGTKSVGLPAKANARLMAAAPGLLDALEDVVDLIHSQRWGKDWDEHEAMLKASAALKAAEEG